MTTPYGYRVSFRDSVSSVTATIPSGYALGMERIDGGTTYRYCYNAGNSQIGPGYCFKTVGGGSGPYSITISTTTEVISDTLGVIPGAHNTATTGTYFWAATKGEVGKLLVSNVSIATDAAIAVAANGALTKLTSNTAAIGINLGNSNGTGATDTLSGDFLIDCESLKYAMTIEA